MGKVKIGIFCAVFSLFFLSLGFSETILLKSGQKVEGRVIEKTDKYVRLDFLGVDLIYYNDEVASITQGDVASAGTPSPQLESLYQAYASSLNVPQKIKEEKGTEIPFLPIIPQAAATSQPASAIAPNASLSQLPPEYQKMIQSVMQEIQGVQTGLPGGSPSTAGMPLGGDLSQLPPEYQKVIKSTVANLQAANSGAARKRDN
ncbi:MAG: hypothetical protein PHR73_04495 [Candidatus Omnitrophica bacterium]|nr:hypothetical protein [Candidatus Omnitrophota bacterium]